MLGDIAGTLLIVGCIIGIIFGAASILSYSSRNTSGFAADVFNKSGIFLYIGVGCDAVALILLAIEWCLK